MLPAPLAGRRSEVQTSFLLRRSGDARKPLEVSPVKLARTAARFGAVIGSVALALTVTMSGAAAAGGGDQGGGGGNHPDTPAPKPLALRILSVNDFHGNLQPPTGSSGRITLS